MVLKNGVNRALAAGLLRSLHRNKCLSHEAAREEQYQLLRISSSVQEAARFLELANT